MAKKKTDLPKYKIKKQFITTKNTYNVGDDFQHGKQAVIDYLKLNNYI